jgi:hypothetical protein
MIIRRKIFAIIMGLSVISSVLMPSFLPTHIRKAQAAVPVIEQNPIVLANTAANEASIAQTLLEYAEEFILETLKKRLLDMMVDQIIQWIQGGGEPQFVTDWDGFLRNAANAATGDFIQEIGLGFLCDPFSLQVQIALLPIPRFSDDITCTLDQITDNIENFYADFRNGSWIAYTGSLEPQNNYFGALSMASSELEYRKARAEAAALNEATAGGGFLSTKKCDVNGKNCVITTPGDTIGSLVSKAVGTEFDYILSAEQLSDYAAAIANAAINRLIVEGVNGLQGVSTSNAPRSGTIPAGGGVCAGLNAAALAACLNASQTANGNFGVAKSNLRQQLNQSINPREEADGFYEDTIARLIVYQTDLQRIIGQINIATCALGPQYVTEIQLEMGFASSTALTLSDARARNQDTIAELIVFRDQVNALSPGDWTGLSKLASEINKSGIVNTVTAVNLRAQIETRNTNIQTRITDTIKLFNQYAVIC